MPTDNSARTHIEASSTEIEAFVLRLEKLLGIKAAAIIREIKFGEKTARNNAKDAARILAQLEQVLIDADLVDEVDKLRNIYGKELHFIRDVYFKDVANQAQFYAGTDKDVIETLIHFDTSRVFTHVTGYVDDIQSTLMRAVLTGDVPNFNQVSSDAFNAGTLQTEITTGLQGFSRTVTMKKAKDVGFTRFKYLGPLDQVTRKFCEHVLEEGPVYTLEEIQAMDNGQGLPVMTYGGGYNCRHQWRPVE